MPVLETFTSIILDDFQRLEWLQGKEGFENCVERDVYEEWRDPTPFNHC